MSPRRRLKETNERKKERDTKIHLLHLYVLWHKSTGKQTHTTNEPQTSGDVRKNPIVRKVPAGTHSPTKHITFYDDMEGSKESGNKEGLEPKTHPLR